MKLWTWSYLSLLCEWLSPTLINYYFLDTCNGKEENPRPGVYLQAFCNGLNEVLVPYRDGIVKLEEKALEDPYLPLLTVVSKVEEYTKLFEVLNSMIKQVRRSCLLSPFQLTMFSSVKHFLSMHSNWQLCSYFQ